MNDRTPKTIVFAGMLLAMLTVTAVAYRVAHRDDRDDSDAAKGPRSGFAVRTDHLTGCQYLTTLVGGITPRLDVNGRHICRTDLKNASAAQP